MCSLSRILKLSVLLPVLAFSNFSFAQKYFQPGHIINLNGDTIKGRIYYKNWVSAPDIIKFIPENDSNEIVCSFNNIKGFEVAGEKYESATIRTEVSGESISNLSTVPELNFEKDTAFLQTQILGAKTLYYYQSHQGRNQYYIKIDGNFVLLIYKRYQFDNGVSALAIKENKGYLNQLKNYFGDCASLESKLKNVKYTTQSLSAIFDEYYKCKGISKEFSIKHDKIKFETGVVTGVSFTKSGIEYLLLNSYPAVNFNISLNFSAGLYANIIFPRNMGRWSIYNELLYSAYKIKSQLLNGWEGVASLSYSYLKMNNMVRYKFPVESLFMFINAGFSNGYALKSSSLVDYASGSSEKDLGLSRKYEQGLLLGAGIIYDRFSVEARAEIGNGMSDLINYPTPCNRMFLLLGYRF